MTFEWDNQKNEYNKKNHDGISFEFAVRVFLDEKRIENSLGCIQAIQKTDGMLSEGLKMFFLLFIPNEMKELGLFLQEKRHRRK